MIQRSHIRTCSPLGDAGRPEQRERSSSLLFTSSLSLLGLNRGICWPSLSSMKTSWRFHLRKNQKYSLSSMKTLRQRTWFKRKLFAGMSKFSNYFMLAVYNNVLTFYSRLSLLKSPSRQVSQWMAGIREGAPHSYFPNSLNLQLLL